MYGRVHVEARVAPLVSISLSNPNTVLPIRQVLDAESMKLVKEIEAQKCDARDRPVAGVKITASGVM